MLLMPRYPHTRFYSNPRHAVVLTGPHVQLLDMHGRILHSTTSFGREDKVALINSGPIRCSAVSKNGRYLATSGDDKLLKIWDLEPLGLLSTRELPKKPTCIEFSANADILVSDKFGDISRYTLHPEDQPVKKKTAGETHPSHENAPSGELLLGHASLLTSFLLMSDEKYIITADRDEHIRVSWYPEGYVIESYCLGHKKYVSAIHIPAVSPTLLISGGGDSELKVWDWMAGQLRQNIAVFAAVAPFIRVAAQVRSHQSLAETDKEEPTKSRARRTTTGKEKECDTIASSHDPPIGERLEDSGIISDVAFVVHRISSFISHGENHVVFNVVGATAIFDFVLAEALHQPDIRHYDFKRPVIDFTVCGEGTIWVLLDADFPEEHDTSDEHSSKLVRVVEWSVDKFIDAASSKLLDSLNTICSLPATAADLQVLDLYADLSSLPKTVDQKRGLGLEQSKSVNKTMEDEGGGEGTVSVGLTKRALGRLKHKRALDRLHHDSHDHEAENMKACSDDEL